MKKYICKFASSGCNAPEGECSGICMSHGFVQLEQDLGKPRFFWPMVITSVLILLLGCWGLAQFWDDLSYRQAMEDQHTVAKEQQMKELILQRKRQEACGGEEATVIELVHGGFACLDKDGRRRMPSGKH